MRTLDWLRGFVPIRVDTSLPDVSLAARRTSPRDFSYRVECPRMVDQPAYLRATVFLANGESGQHRIDVEGELPKNCDWTALTKIPQDLLKSDSPQPSHGSIQDLRFILLVSKSRRPVSFYGRFDGRIVLSREPPSAWNQFRFLWRHCRLVSLSMLLWLAALLVGLGLGVRFLPGALP